jgi:hypothetical protein
LQVELESETLMRVVQLAIDYSTPWANPSIWSNPDFDDECKAAVWQVRLLRRRHMRTKGPYDWMRYAEARNQKTRLIEKALSRAHRCRVQQVIEDGLQGMWRLAKYVEKLQSSLWNRPHPFVKDPRPQTYASRGRYNLLYR